MMRLAAVASTLLAIAGFGTVLFMNPAPPPRESASSASEPPRRERHLTATGLEVLQTSWDPAGIATLSLVGFADNWLDDEALNAIRRYPRVRAMMFGSDKITDAGIRHLATLNQLEGVLLFCPKVSDEGLRRLAAIPSIKAIGLYDAAVTPAGLAEVRQRYPNLLIDVYGEDDSESQANRMFDSNGCPSTYFRRTYWRLRNPTVQATR